MGLLAMLPLTALANTGSASQNANTAQSLATCSHHFYAGRVPEFVGSKGKKLNAKTHELCFDGFGVLYSGISRTPIYSAEHLTKARIQEAKALTREDSFHEESRLPHAMRATLADYKQSGYDRGHLAPNGDMASKSQQFDSFSLANIAPQNGTHNRTLWRHIETTTRYLSYKHGETYVITGVLFQGKNINAIGSGVLVPSHFFKAIYVPSLHKAGVYMSPNSENGGYEVLSLAKFADQSGISLMPSLPPEVQNTAFELPRPMADDGIDVVKQDKKNTTTPTATNATNDEEASGWAVLIVAILKFLVGLFK